MVVVVGVVGGGGCVWRWWVYFLVMLQFVGQAVVVGLCVRGRGEERGLALTRVTRTTALGHGLSLTTSAVLSWNTPDTGVTAVRSVCE